MVLSEGSCGAEPPRQPYDRVDGSAESETSCFDYYSEFVAAGGLCSGLR